MNAMNTTSLYNHIRQDLVARFGSIIAPAEITAIFESTVAAHETRATVRTFVPVLVERDVTRALRERAEAAGRAAALAQLAAGVPTPDRLTTAPLATAA